MEVKRDQYMIRSMKQITVGMRIRFISQWRTFDYIVVDLSRKAKCLMVVKQDDTRKHPRKMVLKNIHLFIKRGLVWADEP